MVIALGLQIGCSWQCFCRSGFLLIRRSCRGSLARNATAHF